MSDEPTVEVPVSELDRVIADKLLQALPLDAVERDRLLDLLSNEHGWTERGDRGGASHER